MPVSHVLLAKPGPGRDDDVEAVLAALARFAETLPGPVRTISGRDVSQEGFQQGYRLGLVMEFEDEAGRQAYLRHPQHGELAAELSAATQVCAVLAIAGEFAGSLEEHGR
jgi:hypothetical protein